MSLNLIDRITLIESTHMQRRLQGAVAQYALYLLGGTPTEAQLAWAQSAVRDSANIGRAVGYHVLDDTNFLAGGSDITDAQLQGAVEAAVNSRFIV